MCLFFNNFATTLPSLSKRTVKLFVCLFVVVVLIANFTHQCRIFFCYYCRMNFLYGCVIPRELVAFSDPTPDGKRLAQTYAGTSQFLVFR